MKFRFRSSQMGEVQAGLIEARDLEDAEARLERKGLYDVSVAPVLGVNSKKYSITFGLFCLLGLLVMFTHGGEVTSSALKPEQESSRLAVEGQVEGRTPKATDVVVVVYPELPLRMLAKWEEVGTESGKFRLQTEISYQGPAPTYLHISLLDESGTLLTSVLRRPFGPRRSLTEPYVLSLE